MSRLTRSDHVEMMKEPERWPLYSVLAMKRSNSGELTIDEGFAIMVAYDPLAVYKIGVGRLTPGSLLKTQLVGVPRLEYASYEDIYDDGWRVD